MLCYLSNSGSNAANGDSIIGHNPKKFYLVSLWMFVHQCGSFYLVRVHFRMIELWCDAEFLCESYLLFQSNVLPAFWSVKWPLCHLGLKEICWVQIPGAIYQITSVGFQKTGSSMTLLRRLQNLQVKLRLSPTPTGLCNHSTCDLSYVFFLIISALWKIQVWIWGKLD